MNCFDALKRVGAKFAFSAGKKKLFFLFRRVVDKLDGERWVGGKL